MIKKNIFLIISFLILSISTLSAQESAKSDSIKWIGGEKFYIHTVTQGQGLYSIKKLYNVSEKDILENNPEVFDGLKPGQQLKIPFIKAEQKELGYRIHIIKSGETIYSISKQYNVSQESIFKLNPEAKNGYKINQKLKIPLEEKQGQTENEDSTDKKTYKIKKKDTLYSLSKKFGVSQEELLAANPIIAEEGLKKGQRITIPKKEIIIKEALYMPVDTMQYSDISLLDDTVSCDSSIIKRYAPMNVGLFLPFAIDKMAFERELENTSSLKPQFSKKPFLEFYEGFLLAINELKTKGYKINIHVFNTRKDSNEVKRILKKGIIQDLDLIIGPVYPENFKIVQSSTNSMHIPIINPIIAGTNVIDNSEYTIDIFPSNKIIMEQFNKLLIQNDSSDIYIVHSGFTDDLMLVNSYKKTYLNALIEAGKDTTNYFKELIFPDSKNIEFEPHLNKEKESLFIILSDNQAFVSNIFTKLNILTDEYKVQVIARPKWQKFDNIDVSYYHNLNVLQLSYEFVDYNDPQVVSFIKRFRKYFNIEPSKYAFYSYDITRNFVDYFYQWDKISCLKHYAYKNTSLGFDIQKTKTGWINKSIFVIRYNTDYSVEKLYQIKSVVNKCK